MAIETFNILSKRTLTWDVHKPKDQSRGEICFHLLKRIIHCILQRRHVVAFLGLLCSAIMNSHRIVLSIALVAMVNATASNNDHQQNYANNECPAYYVNTTSLKKPKGEFKWSPALQGYIISAGYVGYILTQIPGGILAKIFGSKKLLVIGLLVAAVSNLLSPLAAKEHPYVLLALALIRGMAQGIKQPALSVLMSKWFPKNERGSLCALIFSGHPLGAIVTDVVGGKLCELEFLGGWPLVFYVFGVLSAILALIFMIFYFDLPEEDPRISESELDLIQSNQEKSEFGERPPTPWLKLVLSIPTLALSIGIFGQNWMNYYIISVHTIYIGTVLNVPIRENGVMSATPFILQALAGWLTCFLTYRNSKFKIDSLRKGCNSFSCILFSIGLLGIYFAKCNILLNEIFLHMSVGGIGFAFGGALITAVDMSPTFCGPLMGFANTLGSLSGFIVPITVGELTNEEQNLTQWGKVFFISVGLSLGCALIFQLFGSAEIQSYDPVTSKLPEESEPDNEREKDESERTRF